MGIADSLNEMLPTSYSKIVSGVMNNCGNWKIKEMDFYWVKNKNSQKCLDIEKTKKNDFDSVMQWSCRDVSNINSAFKSPLMPPFMRYNRKCCYYGGGDRKKFTKTLITS